jgi:putative transposase
MKKFLLDPKYITWPIHAIHSEAVRLKALFIGRHSWYKYSKILGFKRFYFKKPRHLKGIRAFNPNEIIHADVTCLKLLDGLTAYIYLIVDNFSRFIISYKTSLRISAEIALVNLKDAYYSIIKNNSDPIPTIIFLTDGGPENDNNTIKQYLEDKITIKHLTAKKHIRFSNSMIEAVNKTLKYSWLFTRQFHNIKDLEKYLVKAVHEYNYVRPHHAHIYQTPAEAYSGKLPNLDFIQAQFEEAHVRRIQENRLVSCPICRF